MDEVGWSWLLLILFSGGSLFFSLTSMALRGYSRVRLQEAFKSLGREERAETLVERTENLLLTCSFYRLVCNAIVMILLVYLFVVRPAGVSLHSGYLISFAIAVLLLPVLALAIPHAWAKHGGEKVLARSLTLLLAITWLSRPILRIFSFYDYVIRRLAGISETSPEEAEEEREEEFLSVVEQGRMEGVVDAEEQEMIENVLELSETEVGEIMTPRTDMVAVDVEADLQTVLTTITEGAHSRVPVYELNIDNIVGLLYARDLLTELGKDPAAFRVSQKMREAYFVPETKPLRSLLHEFQNNKLQVAVVLDEYGGTAGIITIEDIIEELVGEITDEFENIAPETIQQIEDNMIEVDARVYVDDINEDYNLELPDEEDYDTLGGFVFSHMGYIPKTGESFEYRGLRFTIVAAEPRQVKRIRIERLAGLLKPA